jgi:hypothetical protein
MCPGPFTTSVSRMWKCSIISQCASSTIGITTSWKASPGLNSTVPVNGLKSDAVLP